MKKFKFLILFGLKKRLFKKSFIITNVLLGLLIMTIINIPAIFDAFSSDDIETINVKITNNTTDQDYPLETTILSMMNMAYEETRYVSKETREAPDDFWDDDTLDIWVVFEGDLNAPDVDLYLKDVSEQDGLMNTIRNGLLDYQNVQYATYNVIDPPPSDDGGLDPTTRNMVEGIITLLVLPVFLLIIMATQFLGVDIIEEKSSKVIETIISSVPSTYHFLSKIIANIAFLIIQSGLLLGFAAMGALIGRIIYASSDIEAVSLIAGLVNNIPNLASILIILFLFLVVGTLLFLALAALIASIATTQEDYQQFQTPLIFLLLGGFYIGIFMPMIGIDSVVRVAAYIPFFSTMVAPIAYATGIISLLEAIFILVLLVITVALFLYFMTPVYRVAILSYEETKFFKRIRFYVKKAFAKKP